MKIACIKGSPRVNGNSSRLADYFLKNFDSIENEIKTFNLNQLNYRGCQGCRKCLTAAEKCIINDDLQEVLEAVRESDILVLASGVYYGELTSQVKGFIDRTYSFNAPDFIINPNSSRLKSGKCLVMILAQGHPDENMFKDIFTRYNYFFEKKGFSKNYLIRACGVLNKGDIDSRKDVLKQADTVAEEILKKEIN
jgi:multimeric flavodoxin WrbA